MNFWMSDFMTDCISVIDFFILLRCVCRLMVGEIQNIDH